MDENVEYEERESEFDIEDEDKSPQLHTEKQDEDEVVDVVTIEPIAAFCSRYTSIDSLDAVKLWLSWVHPNIAVLIKT